MTTITARTVCDVTGEEVPTLRAQIGPSHQYDLSHEGAISLLQGVSLPNREAQTYIIARCRPSDLPGEPLNGSEPIEWQFSRSAYEKKIDATRKQAARECLEIMQSEVNRIIYQGPYFEPERNITERILKAFGL